jgi:signal transduction histidine kinase
MTRAWPPRRYWRYLRGLIVPALLWGLFIGLLVSTLWSRLHGDEAFDEAAMREWVEESRVFRETLPELVHSYLDAAAQENTDPEDLVVQGQMIQQQLRSLGDPTKMYQAQLPLFPAIYRLELDFPAGGDPPLAAIVWESGIPRPRYSDQVRRLAHSILGPHDGRAVLTIEYQCHAYNKRQRDEQAANQRLRWLSALAVAATALGFLWIYLVQAKERAREQQRLHAQQQIDRAERLLLEGELRRQEVERRQEDTERKLLEQRLATQAAERRALELKSQLYASIGIMAGSYAHNIKNLLVRPNDLLRRCLEADGIAPQQAHMLQEVRQTLGTVTERLQQILQTVRRDPSRSELTRLNLNDVVADIQRTWQELAHEKWKLTLTAELSPEPPWVAGDLSHLQQAIENLLFNARDATFEMRSRLRDQARRLAGEAGAERVATADDVRQALIAAAAWRGSVTLRTRREGEQPVLEVQDNGVGMTEEVRRHCTETHFSTKRDNAIYEGNSTGMGLGLSFVVVILEHHRATLSIESEPLRGALFRAVFPLLGEGVPDAGPTP